MSDKRDFMHTTILGFSLFNPPVIYDAQRGLPLQYDDALLLKQALDEYLALGREAVTATCLEALEEQVSRQRIEDPKFGEFKRGFIYVIERDGLYKIGKTQSLKERLSQYQTGSPTPINVVVTFETPDIDLIESMLHDLFKAKRVMGEWFRLSAEDIDIIKAMPQ